MPTGKNTPFNVTLLGFLLAVTLFTQSPQLHGASIMSSFTSKLTCHFFHANLFHWVCNALCLWLMRPCPTQITIAVPYAVMAMYFTDEPTIGFSAIIYAYVGMNILRWKLSIEDWITFIVANFIGAFLPGIAFGVHFMALFFGFAHYIIERQLRRIKEKLES